MSDTPPAAATPAQLRTQMLALQGEIAQNELTQNTAALAVLNGATLQGELAKIKALLPDLDQTEQTYDNLNRLVNSVPATVQSLTIIQPTLQAKITAAASAS